MPISVDDDTGVGYILWEQEPFVGNIQQNEDGNFGYYDEGDESGYNH